MVPTSLNTDLIFQLQEKGILLGREGQTKSSKSKTLQDKGELNYSFLLLTPDC